MVDAFVTFVDDDDDVLALVFRVVGMGGWIGRADFIELSACPPAV